MIKRQPIHHTKQRQNIALQRLRRITKTGVKINTEADKRTIEKDKQKTEDRFKIAIVSTACWGDNINSTMMHKPLRTAYPHAIIDVHTSDRYASAFYNNPYINNIVEYRADSKNAALHLMCEVPDKIKNAGYNLIIAKHPMYNTPWFSDVHRMFGENLINTWARALDELGVKYNIPYESILRLTDKEVSRVRAFLRQIPALNSKNNILMEVEAESGQTFWDNNWTNSTIKHLLKNTSNRIFVSRRYITDDLKEIINNCNNRVHFVGDLSIRECAELFNHCKAFISISSGLSNACNTDWCKKDIKWFEVINSMAVSSEPMRSTGKIFVLKNDLNEFLSTLSSNEL